MRQQVRLEIGNVERAEYRFVILYWGKNGADGNSYPTHFEDYVIAAPVSMMNEHVREQGEAACLEYAAKHGIYKDYPKEVAYIGPVGVS